MLRHHLRSTLRLPPTFPRQRNDGNSSTPTSPSLVPTRNASWLALHHRGNPPLLERNAAEAPAAQRNSPLLPPFQLAPRGFRREHERQGCPAGEDVEDDENRGGGEGKRDDARRGFGGNDSLENSEGSQLDNRGFSVLGGGEELRVRRGMKRRTKFCVGLRASDVIAQENKLR